MKLLTLSNIIDNEAKKANDREKGGFMDNIEAAKSALEMILTWSVFLKKPLTLSMFVPCKDGKPLEKPVMYDVWVENGEPSPVKNTWLESCKAYEQAQKAVLFKGFEVKFSSDIDVILSNGQLELGFYKVNEGVIIKVLENGNLLSSVKPMKTVSDLAEATQDNPIELNESN